MQRFYVPFVAMLMCFLAAPQVGKSQSLLISELLANPIGNDSAKEWIELIATKHINFAVTPYSVVVNNNGTATTAGWVAGGNLTYGYNINTGSVQPGDVVYVGGSGMVVGGPIIRAINNVNTPGDGFGNANASGVIGNGGGNADGVAVFNVPISQVTNSTVPVDVIFFGTGMGSAVVSGGTAGYVVPVNDRYNGGFLQTNSFLAPDAVSGSYLKAVGTYDTILNTFTGIRTWTNTTVYTNTSEITLTNVPPPANLTFSSSHQTVAETAGTATFSITVSNANSLPTTVEIEAVFGTATNGSDYNFSTFILNIPANGNGSYPVSVSIVNDTDLEQTEYVFFRMKNPVNGNITGVNQHTLYIKDEDRTAPIASNTLSLNLLASFANGPATGNSAEISAFDPTNNRLYIANSIGAKLNIVDFSNPSFPTPISTIAISSYGNINSVDVRDGLVALAIENANPQMPGKVVFLDANGSFINEVGVGAMPDMITFNHAGTKVLTANEGEPNNAYTIDPEGSVSVVDISNGVANATVTNILFTQFNGQEAALRAQGVRIFGANNASAAQDFEPEYITISPDDQTAWVTLQENNAVLKIDLTNNSIVEIQPLGTIDHNLMGFGMDVSDQTNAINIANWKVKGMFLPDAISYFEVGGTPYYITANEGDARAYTGLNEETRVSNMNLDATAFPDAAFLKSNLALGRLLATNRNGDLDNDGDFDEIYTLGTRSFSIRNANTGTLVYDSGDDMEQITANHPIFSAMFNASNAGSSAPKNRSDDKGPEPEGVVVSEIGGVKYAFVALERIGGVMVYDVSNPTAPTFVTYANNRSPLTNGPDRGAEGIIHIPASQSPIGQDILVISNEISNTLSIYAICPGGDTLQTFYADADGDGYGNANITTKACNQPIGFSNNTLDCNDSNANINPEANEICGNGVDENCDGQDGALDFIATLTPNCNLDNRNRVVISSVTGGNAPFQYSKDGGEIFQNSPTFNNLTPGTYVFVVRGNGGVCTGSQTVTINSPMTLEISGQDILCAGQPGSASVTVTGGYPDFSYLWTRGTTTVGNTATIENLAPGTYKVQVTDQFGCKKTATRMLANPSPLVLTVTKKDITCFGETDGQASAKATGGTGTKTFAWSNGATTADINQLPAGIYTVTTTDANGCTASVSVEISEPTALEFASISETLLTNGKYRVTIVAGGGTPNYKYQRQLPTGNFQTNATGIFSNLNAGNYNFQILDKNGCTVATNYTVPSNNNRPAEVVGRSENDSSVNSTSTHSFSLQPNPAQHFVRLIFEEGSTPIGMIEIRNAAGAVLRQISTEQILANGGVISIDELPAGMMFMNIRSNAGENVILRFVKI